MDFKNIDFVFAKLPKIFVSQGCFSKLVDKIQQLDPGVIIIVTGKNSYKNTNHFDILNKTCKDYGFSSYHVICESEPDPALVDNVCKDLKGSKVSLCIGKGGGSALDAAKAISAMLCESEPVKNYLEGVGDLKPSGNRLPLVMLPTTSGTGSEVTKNAVISSIGGDGFKKSLRHDGYIADEVYIDSDLLINCPNETTAACGLDAITQLLEAYVSPNASALTDALAYSGLECALKSYMPCSDDANLDIKDQHYHRLQMGYAAMLSGITLANAGLGVVHGYASPIGARYPIPHGVVCANLLPIATEVNVKALFMRDPKSIALKKLSKVGKIIEPLAKDDFESINNLIQTFYAFVKDNHIKTLGSYGLTKDDINKMLPTLDQKTNPIKLTQDELFEIGVARI